MRPAPSSTAVSLRMSRQRSRDTAPEVALRRELHREGCGSAWKGGPSLTLRSTADIVFRAERGVAVYVDGCFWHACPEHATRPRSNGRVVGGQARPELGARQAGRLSLGGGGLGGGSCLGTRDEPRGGRPRRTDRANPAGCLRRIALSGTPRGHSRRPRCPELGRDSLVAQQSRRRLTTLGPDIWSERPTGRAAVNARRASMRYDLTDTDGRVCASYGHVMMDLAEAWSDKLGRSGRHP